MWRVHGLKPHLVRTFKLGHDPRFEEKLRDVVGLYLDPPHNAAVFSFDDRHAACGAKHAEWPGSRRSSQRRDGPRETEAGRTLTVATLLALAACGA